MYSTLPIFLSLTLRWFFVKPSMLSIEKGRILSSCWSSKWCESLSLPLLSLGSEVSEYLLDFPLMIRLITASGGRFSLLHTPSARSRSFSSHEKMLGFSRLYSSILLLISLLTSREVLRRALPASNEPVSLYLARSLLMQPWETRSCLLISHGRIPLSASSMIFCRTLSGKAFPLTNEPPSWLSFPIQIKEKYVKQISSIYELPTSSITPPCFFFRNDTTCHHVQQLSIS